MGAATSLMHGDRDPSIAGMVIDSPFSSLNRLSDELARTYSRVPGFVVSAAKSLVRKTIKNKAGFNINDLEPIRHVDKCFIPAMFIAATGDLLISPSHTHDLHQNYAGDKSLSLIDGDHNSQRPQYILDSIAIFFHNTLQCELLPKTSENKSFDHADLEKKMQKGMNRLERSLNIFDDDSENQRNAGNIVYNVELDPRKKVKNTNLLDL